MRVRTKKLLQIGAALTVGGVLLLLTTFAGAASGQAQHVSWGIINFSPLPPVPPFTFSPGGVASAEAAFGGGTITLTGSGTFVAPTGGGGSNGVTGGGTWTTTSPYAGSGTYKVKELVAWQFDKLQVTPPAVIDETGDVLERANGSAVLRIEFSDGQSGVLTVGCHGPGAEPGIFEGIATTKGFKTYYNVPTPSPTVNEGRTIFHVRS